MRVHLLQILLSLLLFQREFGIRNHPLQGHNLLREFGIKIYLSKIKDDLAFLLSGTQCLAVIPLKSGIQCLPPGLCAFRIFSGFRFSAE